jgi:DNA polymerase III alpha subunit
MAVKGLSVYEAWTIIDERKQTGDFTSLDDFSRQVRLNRDDIIVLCPAVVFDSIAVGTSRYLQSRRLLVNNKEKVSNKGIRNLDLFASEVSPAFDITQKSVIAPQVKRLLKPLTTYGKNITFRGFYGRPTRLRCGKMTYW